VQSRLSTVGAIVHLVSRSRRRRLDDGSALSGRRSRAVRTACYTAAWHVGFLMLAGQFATAKRKKK